MGGGCGEWNRDDVGQRDVFEQVQWTAMNEESEASDTLLGYGMFLSSNSAPDEDAKPYLRVPLNIDGKFVDSDKAALLVRFYMENVWRLPAPQLLISIIGSHQADNLHEDSQNAMMKIMDAARQTHAWLVTDGIKTGISKLVGNVRSGKNCVLLRNFSVLMKAFSY